MRNGGKEKRTKQKAVKHADLADKCTEFTRSEIIIDTSEDGDGDYNVTEETSEVVKSVHPN